MALSPELAAYSDEDDFVQRFLVPLLGRLGFGIVVNHHGQSEAGMDLIVGEIDRFAHVRYHGIQAKFENSISKSASHGLVQDATEAFADEFTHPLRNLRSFADVGRAAKPAVRFQRAIFAFESAGFSGDTLHDWYVTADVADEPWSYPQIIHVLREGTLHLENIKPANTFGYRFVMGEEGDEFKSRGLSMFLQTIRKALEVKAGLDSNPFEYADLRELRFSTQYLRIKQGFVTP